MNENRLVICPYCQAKNRLPEGISLASHKVKCGSCHKLLETEKRETMSILTWLFGKSPPQDGVLVCQHCQERYHLDKVITSSGDDVMNNLYGNAIVIGDSRGLRAGPVLIGHSDHTTDKDDRENLKKATKQGWTCRKCKADNSWDNSYSRA
jgi:hypothetical protein